MSTIGVDFGGTNIRMGVVENGFIFSSVSEPTRAGASEQEIIDHLKGMLRELITPRVELIGIGVPSVVDTKKGIVYNVTNIPSWKEVPLKKILENEFNIPVRINNDSNCFALGEYRFGEGRTYRDIVCVTLGTGVGSGIIVRGKLYEGSNAGAGEIGGIPYLEKDYEYYCSSRFFTEENGVNGREVYEKALNNDKAALALFIRFGEHVGNLIKLIMYTYDPQAIILGGSISRSYPFFSQSMFWSMSDFPYPETLRKIRVVLSRTENISLLGASALT